MLAAKKYWDFENVRILIEKHREKVPTKDLLILKKELRNNKKQSENLCSSSFEKLRNYPNFMKYQYDQNYKSNTGTNRQEWPIDTSNTNLPKYLDLPKSTTITHNHRRRMMEEYLTSSNSTSISPNFTNQTSSNRA
jgi:hypothetical protein